MILKTRSHLTFQAVIRLMRAVFVLNSLKVMAVKFSVWRFYDSMSVTAIFEFSKMLGCARKKSLALFSNKLRFNRRSVSEVSIIVPSSKKTAAWKTKQADRYM